MISGLHHYALEVPDLAVAEGFLQDFGLETGEKDGSLVAMCPGRQQEQVRLVEAPAKRLHHVAPIFADIDGMDADKFIAHLTPDVRFRFANMDPAIGHAAVKEGVEGFWTTIDGLTHHILKAHEIGDTVIAQIDVEYRRKDGKSVTVPNCDVLVFDGDLVRDWQIYIDLAPVFA